MKIEIKEKREKKKRGGKGKERMRNLRLNIMQWNTMEKE